ncbi:hypothetical protein [Legionella donaldsonii]|uniref:hypothetical protein n=1 Tax=Legionella donaldsonii TaxID=45060 RepID=UPI00399C5762
MLRAILISFFLLIGCINLESWAGVFNKSNFPGLLAIEGTIYKAAVEKGLSESDISIKWEKISTGEYKAIIQCINLNKCGESQTEIFISTQEAESNHSPSAHALEEIEHNLFNASNPSMTGNEGPGITNKKEGKNNE